MRNQFELAGGSIIGREHLRVGKNNQDAYFWEIVDNGVIAVVCDGCGSGKHTEVGAKLGARLVARTLQQSLSLELNLEQEETWQVLQDAWLRQLTTIAEQLGGDRLQTVQDYLSFTIVGAVLTSTTTAIFALGDGVIAINEQVIGLESFVNNAPPYIGYGLLTEKKIELLPLKVLQVLPTAQVNSLLIGSDGVNDLVAVAQQSLPGRSQPVGEIAQFWQSDRYFHNPDQIRRQLALINREVTTFDLQTQQCLRQSGLLPDDTTLIVIRRKETIC